MRALLTGFLVGAAVVAVLALGAWSLVERRAAAALDRRFDIPLETVRVPADSASMAEGERLGWLVGCHSCHGDSLEGKVFVDEPKVLRLVAPNVIDVARGYTDAELERLVRHGVRRDGRGVVAMPAATTYHLSDADVGRLIASLRAAPLVRRELPATELRAFGTMAAALGRIVPDAATIDHLGARLGDRGDTTRAARGEYLARITCAECHGATLMGSATSPALVKAYGYSSAEFVSLLLDGRARDGRDLGLMRRTSQARFIRFTRDEIEAIYAWLQVMPVRPAAASAAAR